MVRRSFILVAACAVLATSGLPAHAGHNRDYFSVGAFAGIYQADDLAGGLDGFGFQGSACLMGSYGGPAHLLMRLSTYRPLDDSSSGWGGELAVGIGVAGGGVARTRSAGAGGRYWVFERNDRGEPVRVVERGASEAVGPSSTWWDLAPFFGFRGVAHAADDGGGGVPGGLRAAQFGLSAVLGRDRGLLLVRGAALYEFDSGHSGIHGSLLGKTGHFGIELSFSGYVDFGHEFVLSLGGWL